jgi:hypothetical protein
VCGEIEFDSTTVDHAQSGFTLFTCQGCGAVFHDLDKATKAAARIADEREREIERRTAEAIAAHDHLRHGVDDY